MEIKNFQFLKDEPITPGTPGYFDFYHKYFSPALKDMVLSDSCPHTIGLFSKWGTGKSSIVDQLSKDLETENRAHVFIFDTWKYQEDSLRRTFLIKLYTFLKSKEYKIPEEILSSFYKKKSNSVTSTNDALLPLTEQKGVLGWFKRNWTIIALTIVIVAVAAFYILVTYYPNNKLLTAIRDFLTSVAALGGLVFVLKPVGEKLVDQIVTKMFESTERYTEVRTQIEEEDRLNSPEQFEEIFNSLISCVIEKKLVIVFDNVDRVQGDIALKTLSTIKTFLDPLDKTKVVFLVPCDSDAINQQIKAFYKNQADGGDFDEAEYLRKLFNTVIYTPEFIDDDIHQYTSALIENTGDIKSLLLNENVISVITKAFKSNPREVKQFINNLVAAVLIASKTEVADLILTKENIGFFTKVMVLKQKFSPAYKRLRENWSDPQKIVTEKPEPGLRDFLTLTSTITTDDAEPFIYFKSPQIEGDLTDSKGIRKALVEGNSEEFEKLVSTETKKDKLARFVSRLLKNYKSQPQILLRIFKTQLQGFGNLGEKINNVDFLESCLETIEVIWNNYLELPPPLVFDLLVRSKNTSKREAILDRYVLTLGNEEVKVETNKVYLHDLIEEFIKNKDYMTATHQSKVMDAVRQNLAGRDDILLQFTTLDLQKVFVSPDSIRKILQEDLNNKNLKQYLPILNLYKDYIESLKLGPILLGRIPQFISLQNSETPTNTPEKLAFHENLLIIFNNFGASLKDLSQAQQLEIFNGLNTAYGQVAPGEDVQGKIVNGLRWLSLRATDPNVKTQSDTQINNFISRSSGDALAKVLNYWDEKSRPNFIKAYFASIKARCVSEDSVLRTAYESGDDSQKLELAQHAISQRGDHGIKFLSDLGDKLPDRQEVIKTLLTKAQNLSIQDREPIFQYLKGRIAINDDVGLKQLATKQILEYLKSNDQRLVDFGVTLLSEKFLSDSDQREIAKEMLDFYTNRSGPLQKYDLGVVSHLVQIESKLQDVLKEKVIYLIFSNISPDRQFEILPPLVEEIAAMKPDSDKYEKDYSDLTERIITWPESEQKNQLVKRLAEVFKTVSGEKAKECIKKISPFLKEENKNPQT